MPQKDTSSSNVNGGAATSEGGRENKVSLVRKSTFLGMTDRARYDARRGTKGESSRDGAAYRVLHPRRHLRRATFARGPSSRASLDPIDSAGRARGNLRNIVVNNFLRACERLVETSAARSGSERSTRRSSYEKV